MELEPKRPSWAHMKMDWEIPRGWRARRRWDSLQARIFDLEKDLGLHDHVWNMHDVPDCLRSHYYRSLPDHF